MHVIVSLMASEVDGAPGSARFSLSFFIPNSPEGPLLICFGSGSDAERHLNASVSVLEYHVFCCHLTGQELG